MSIYQWEKSIARQNFLRQTALVLRQIITVSNTARNPGTSKPFRE